MEAVEKLIEQGKVRYAGVCNFNVKQMLEAGKYIKVISNQVPYSMVRREIETAIVPHCFLHKKGVLAYSPLERGLLTGKMSIGHKSQESDHRARSFFFADEKIESTNEFLKKIEPLAKEKNITTAQLVLRWTIGQPGITVVIAGARNDEQAIQNALTVNVPLTTNENSWITAHLSSLKSDKSARAVKRNGKW